MDQMSPGAILILDNYDSFTYNLAHYIAGITGRDPVVCRNDRISVEEAAAFRHIILSPGPGLPKDAGIMPRLIDACHRKSNILGVCLGMQGICEYFGAALQRMKLVRHGVAREVKVEDPADPLFRSLPDRFAAARYHSWICENLPADLAVTATGPEGEVMAVAHRTYPVRGVQFHPESVLTPDGRRMLRNWIEHSMQKEPHGVQA